MNRLVTIGEMVKWIQKNKTGKVFATHTDDDIAFELMDSFNRGILVYNLDEQGNINGVCTGYTIPEKKLAHISNILTTQKGIIKAFMKRFLLNYPDYTIECRRLRGLVIFNNPQRLMERL